MALAHSRGARIPVHSLRGPLLAAYPLSLWKITNAHKVTVEPSQPPTEPIWSSLKRSNYHPLCAAVWGCLLFHYLFEQIGLRLVLVCGGLIVTRDERLQRARCCGTGGFAEPLCCVKRTVDLLSWSLRLLHFSWTVERRRVDICHLLDWWGNVLAGFAYTTFRKIYIYEAYLSYPLRRHSRLTAFDGTITSFGNESFSSCSQEDCHSKHGCFLYFD